MSTASVYPFAPPPAVAVTLPLSGGDAGTAETVVQMCRLVDEGSKDPAVNAFAIGILRAAGIREFDFEGERQAIYAWFRRNIRFLRDIDGKETLRAARETLARRMGDCDCQTIAIAALLKTIGQRVRIITVATHPEAPDLFSHVYCEARDSRGRWIPMDTARKRPAYGLGPTNWFRRYAWDTDDASSTDISNPPGSPRRGPGAPSSRPPIFAGVEGAGLAGELGYSRPRWGGWGLRGPGGAAPRRAATPAQAALRPAAVSRRRAARARMRGLSFDWGGLEQAIPSITAGTAQIIAASRANPTILGAAALTPAAQAAALQSQYGYGPASFSAIPSWVWILGAGAVLLMAVRR